MICADCKPAVLLSLQQGNYLPGEGEEGRTGPDWERREQLGLFPAIWGTAKAVATDPVSTFSRMRRQGGLSTPYWFYLITATVSLSVSYFYNLLFQNAVMSTLLTRQNPNSPFANEFGQFVGTGVGTLVLIVLSPLIATVFLFIHSALIHVCLMICGGARQPFETTFRTVCYAGGSLILFALIPFCGGTIAWVWTLVAECIGMAKAHEIPTGKAVLAVLMPLLFCCAVCGLIVVSAALLGAANLHH
jgi:hypothetical protein